MLKWGKVVESIYNKGDLFPKYTNRGGDLFPKYDSPTRSTKDGEVVKENEIVLKENHGLFGNYLK